MTASGSMKEKPSITQKYLMWEIKQGLLAVIDPLIFIIFSQIDFSFLEKVFYWFFLVRNTLFGLIFNE